MVYRALDRKLAREVALKFISSTDDQLRRRFLTEARSQARLNHEHICKVYEVGEVQGHPYIAMELVRGKSLSVLQRTLNREQRLTLMRDIAQAVHVAHSHGIIHRDLKPSNIVVEEKEDGSLRPVVMDFGLARDQSSEEHLTMTGMVMGTPAYMSPEQAQGEVSRIDRRSDVYSLGAMLYELLSGRLPFAGETTVAMILQVVQSEPTPLRKVNAEIPVDLETIVLTAMAKEVQRRYDTARALAEDLDRFLTGEPIQARKASVIYVLYKRAQKHRVLVVISALCLLSVIALLSLSVRSRMLAARERARAERQSAFSQQLGQDITQMELFMRAATMQPAHDLGREQNVVRARMNKIAQQLPGLPVELRGPTYYALGRGHYVLQEHAQARGLLEQALAVGYDRPEVHVTLGLSLGQLYLQGISALKGELDPVRRKQRRAKLDEELLSATRRHLAQSAGSEIDSPKLIEGWIHFYREDLASAQQAAEIAARETPWDFEPLKLQLLIAVRQFEQQVLQMKLSEFDAMTDRLAEKIQRLSDLARSDPLAATMRILILQQRLMRDIVDHRPLDADFRKILAAIDQFGVLVPNSPLIFAEKASAYAYLARRQEEIGEDPRPAARTAEEAMDDAVRAGDRSPHLNILRNNLLLAMASYADKHGEDPRPYMQRAAAVLESTALQHKGLLFLWNDLCVSECMLAEQEIIHGQDPRTFLKRGLAACETAIRLNSSIESQQVVCEQTPDGPALGG